jgi:hypothetical protein
LHVDEYEAARSALEMTEVVEEVRAAVNLLGLISALDAGEDSKKAPH